MTSIQNIEFSGANEKCDHLRTKQERVIENAKAAEFEFRSKKEAAQQRKLDLDNYRRQLDVMESQLQSLPVINGMYINFSDIFKIMIMIYIMPVALKKAPVS